MASDLTNKIAEKVKEVLEKSPAIKIVDITIMENFFDLVVRLRAGRQRWRILIKASSQEEIRYQPDTIEKIIFRLLLEPPSTYCVIAAFYIGPKEGKICEESGLGYIDLQGNYLFSFGSIFMERRVSEKPKIPEEIFKSIFSLKSSRIIRVILEAKRTAEPTPLTLRNISEQANVSLGLVHDVVSKLMDLGYVEKRREQKGLKIIRPTELLDEWVKRYNLYQNGVTGFYFDKDLMSEQDDFIRYCESRGEKYAFTFTWAASQIMLSTKPTQISTYFSGDIDILEETLGLKKITTGANLIVILPKDESVYYKSLLYSGYVKIVSPIQLYLDLSTFSKEKRTEWEYQKAMENIRKRHIGF